MDGKGKIIKNIHAGIIGSPEFCRRINSTILSRKQGIKTSTAFFSDAWSMLLSDRPNLLFLEIGLQHSDTLHLAVKSLLQEIRERLESEIYIAIALLSPTTLSFGGDLLFENPENLAPSGLVDTYIALPPPSLPSIPSVTEQVWDVIENFHSEAIRRQEGKPPLPALGVGRWTQSQADPASRALWMKWLPRYASYTNENPLIVGETGTGKTNLAFALHYLSEMEGNFIAMTPRDFSSSELIQGELFGAVEGAYTGAVEKWGLVKSAEKGTLFIDELQSIDKDLQGKLITFIENKTYRRVGSTELIDANVRFVFATNKPLPEMIDSDILREDFGYRLERVQLDLLPLNMRRLDITAALAYSLAKIQRQRAHDKPILGFNMNAYRMLFCHQWPGNLRQLENTAAKLCEMADMAGFQLIDESIVTEVFKSRLLGAPMSTAEVFSKAAQDLAGLSLTKKISSIEEGLSKFVETVRISALESTGGDVEQASALIKDNQKLLTLAAQEMLTKKEIRHLK